MTDTPEEAPAAPPPRHRYKPKNFPGSGRMNDDIAALLELGVFSFAVIERTANEEDDNDSRSEYGDDVPVIMFMVRKRPNPKGTYMLLSSLTEHEVDQLEEFFQYLISELRPVCATLDQRALEAKERGDNSFGRLYRPVARFFERKRHGIEHPARVQGGHDVVLEVDADTGVLAASTDRGTGGPVPESSSPDSGA